MSRHWLLGVSALVFAVAMILSPLPWSVTSTPGLDRIAVLPQAAQKPVRMYLDDGGVTLPWPGLAEAEQVRRRGGDHLA